MDFNACNARSVVRANRTHWLIIFVLDAYQMNLDRLAHAMRCHIFRTFPLSISPGAPCILFAILFNLSEQQQQQQRRYTTKMRRTLQMRLDECVGTQRTQKSTEIHAFIQR